MVDMVTKSWNQLESYIFEASDLVLVGDGR